MVSDVISLTNNLFLGSRLRLVRIGRGPRRWRGKKPHVYINIQNERRGGRREVMMVRRGGEKEEAAGMK